MRYTKSQIDAAVNDADGWGEVGYAYRGKQATIPIDGVEVPAEVIERAGGGEGSGEHMHVIIKVGDQYFKKTGYYASHYGGEWDGETVEVEPYQKTVTDYRPVE